MNRILKVAVVASIVLVAGWAQAAPAAQPRTDNPPAIQAPAGFSLLDQAGALLDRIWARVLEIATAPSTRDGEKSPPIVVIEKPKAEGVGDQD